MYGVANVVDGICLETPAKPLERRLHLWVCMKRTNLALPVSVLAASVALAVAPPAFALSFVPQDDHAVVALDARSGERLWSYWPEKLSQGAFELYPDALHVDGSVETTDPWKTLSFWLDPSTGKVIPDAMPSVAPLARSASYGYGAPVVLANGWKADLKEGNDQKIVFKDDTGAAVWTIETMGYPEHVVAWQNTVFWELSYPEGTTVFAYEAGAMTPSYSFDPKTIVSVPDDLPNDRLHLAVYDDELYVGLHQHLFRLDPATGEVKKQWDLSALTGVPFTADAFGEPEFFYGGIEYATYAAEAETLVVAFEARIVALDRPSGTVLWHADPDGMPNKPDPMLHEGLLVVTGGAEIAGERPPPPPPPQLEPTGCSVGAKGQDAGGAWVVGLLGAIAALWARALARRA